MPGGGGRRAILGGTETESGESAYVYMTFNVKTLREGFPDFSISAFTCVCATFNVCVCMLFMTVTHFIIPLLESEETNILP